MERPNPDQLLATIKAEDTYRGKLKIFFGAVAGVGKTYSMLEAARLRKKEGFDVVVGYVETHKRAETEALLEGLEILPSQSINYKNVILREFDVVAALKRNPKLMLVDEMAHSNVPGARHLKRWPDIEELLDQGIDVYTTLNVQHCESANDVVAQITGVNVRETVPDTCVEKADEIELIDLPPEELLKRLKAGKVYLGEQAERAAQHFFQPGNLIALRQLALRYTAHNVDAKMLSYKQTHAISKVWNVSDRFLVCISPSPDAIRLIRAGKRIASDLAAEWVVAYVETPAALSQEDKNRISEMLSFAEELGAQVVTLSGQDIAETLISYAVSKNITKIIVGKPGKRRWRELIFGSIIDKLAHQCEDIDLYLLSGDRQEQKIAVRQRVRDTLSWENVCWSLGILVLCTVINRILFPYFDLVNLIMIYLLSVTLIAYRYGRRMSIIASFLSVLFFDYFFVPPYFTLTVSNIEYILTFVVMLIVGLIIAHLTGQLRYQTNEMRIREDRTQALYDFSRNLSKSSYPDDLFKIARTHIVEFFKCGVVIFAPDVDGKLAVRFGDAHERSITMRECAVAQWVFEHKRAAGKATDTLPGSQGMYVPCTGTEKTVGVIGIFEKEDKQFENPDQYRMLEIFIKQAALAVEGAQLAAAALEAESKITDERLKNFLLTAFSDILPETLTAISQTASEFVKPENIHNEEQRTVLMEKINEEVNALNKLILELPEIIAFKKNKP